MITEPQLCVHVEKSPNIGSCSLPSFPLQPGSVFRVQQWAHSGTIQTAGLHQVDDGEAVGDACPHVPHPEVEPLSVFSGVQVGAQSQLIVILTTGKSRSQSSLYQIKIYRL